jgi:hypothetical protein
MAGSSLLRRFLFGQPDGGQVFVFSAGISYKRGAQAVGLPAIHSIIQHEI